jgi:hypothetical protein
MAPPKVTGGDLYHLWRVSDVHLPRVADAFYDATRQLNGGRGNTGETDDDAFRTAAPAFPGADAMSSPVAEAWDMLRDEMQRGFAQVGDTVLEAAAAIRMAINVYQQVDAQNADLLSRYLADPHLHDPNAPESNPPVPGSADYPGQPVLPG